MTIALTAVEQADLNLAIATAQTAYANNNTPGQLQAGNILGYLDDVATMNRGNGYRPLALDIPPGYIIQKVYSSSTGTGLNAYLAYNAIEHKAILGVAGVNGMSNDAADRGSALTKLGADQARDLASQARNDIALLIDRNEEHGGQLLQIVGGFQSLAGATGGTALIGWAMGMPDTNTDPNRESNAVSAIPDFLNRVKLTLGNINAVNATQAAVNNGISETIVSDFYSNANVKSYNIICGDSTYGSNGYYDIVTQTGGPSYGTNILFDMPGQYSASSDGVHLLHNMNGCTANWLYQHNFDLTQATALENRPIITAQELNSSLSSMSDFFKPDGSWASLTVTAYPAFVIAAPGTIAPAVSQMLKGFDPKLPDFFADFAGLVLEVLPKATAPILASAAFSNPVIALAALFASGIGAKQRSEAPPTAIQGLVPDQGEDTLSRNFYRASDGTEFAADKMRDGSTVMYFADRSSVELRNEVAVWGSADRATVIYQAFDGAKNYAVLSNQDGSMTIELPAGNVVKTGNVGGAFQYRVEYEDGSGYAVYTLNNNGGYSQSNFNSQGQLVSLVPTVYVDGVST